MTARAAYRPMPAALARQLGVFIPGEQEALRDDLFAADAYVTKQRRLLRSFIDRINAGDRSEITVENLKWSMYYFGAAQHWVKEAEAALADYAHRHHL